MCVESSDRKCNVNTVILHSTDIRPDRHNRSIRELFKNDIVLYDYMTCGHRFVFLPRYHNIIYYFLNVLIVLGRRRRNRRVSDNISHLNGLPMSVIGFQSGHYYFTCLFESLKYLNNYHCIPIYHIIILGGILSFV